MSDVKWKLVPVEPTEEMWKAADKQSEFCAIHNYGASPSAEDYWHAMLDAAPAPEPAGGGVREALLRIRDLPTKTREYGTPDFTHEEQVYDADDVREIIDAALALSTPAQEDGRG